MRLLSVSVLGFLAVMRAPAGTGLAAELASRLPSPSAVRVAGATAQQDNPLGDDPSAFDQRVEAAMMRGDTAFFEAVLSPDVRFTHGNRAVWDKRRWLHFVPRFASSRRDLDSVAVERHGDVVETTGHIRVGAARPKPTPLYQIWYVRLYERREGVWQLLSNRTVREVSGPSPAR